MYCVNCGMEIREGTAFCDACGVKVKSTGRYLDNAVSEMQVENPPDIHGEEGEPWMAFLSVVVVIVMALCIVLMSIYNVDINSSGGELKRAADNTEQTTSNEEENGADNYESESIEGVSEDNDCDYNLLLDKKNYIKYNTGLFSFVYPKDFFSSFSQEGDGTYYFQGNDGVSSLTYEVYPDTGDDPCDTIINLSEEKANQLYGKLYYPYENVGKRFSGYYPEKPSTSDSIHGIVSGYQDEDQTIQEYNYYCSDGENVYYMQFVYPQSEVGGEDSPMSNYIADCYYRGFSVSNAHKHKLRKYDSSNSNN